MLPNGSYYIIASDNFSYLTLADGGINAPIEFHAVMYDDDSQKVSVLSNSYDSSVHLQDLFLVSIGSGSSNTIRIKAPTRLKINNIKNFSVLTAAKMGLGPERVVPGLFKLFKDQENTSNLLFTISRLDD